ncbi:hypothetical protein NDU88_006246 [Pleurodeles waltl]|uniref:Uncharacterized protein n=1 Tax=Pleurodeles waltl TaxID=8319 RepID=A0AAV7LUD0_PLEWA|nr:hypothetical protein NDU88_006246 [Pleurodeles waltl]
MSWGIRISGFPVTPIASVASWQPCEGSGIRPLGFLTPASSSHRKGNRDSVPDSSRDVAGNSCCRLQVGIQQIDL